MQVVRIKKWKKEGGRFCSEMRHKKQLCGLFDGYFKPAGRIFNIKWWKFANTENLLTFYAKDYIMMMAAKIADYYTEE